MEQIKSAKFSLEHLQDCTLWDALRVLYYRKKFAPKTEEIYLVPPFDFFGKQNFYLQHIDCVGENLLLLENAVAELCVKNFENNIWIFVLKQKDNTEIIAGINRGIILTRTLNAKIELPEEINRTIIYLKRFGFDDEPKIISNKSISGSEIIFASDLLKTKQVKNFENPVDGLIEFAKRSNAHVFKKNYSHEILLFLIFIAVFLFLCGIYFVCEINRLVDDISGYPTAFEIKNKNAKIEVNKNNLGELQSFFDEINKSVPFVSEFENLQTKLNGVEVKGVSIDNKHTAVKIFANSAETNSLKKDFEVKEGGEKNTEDNGPDEAREIVCIKK